MYYASSLKDKIREFPARKPVTKKPVMTIQQSLKSIKSKIPRKIFQTHKSQDFINKNVKLLAAQKTWKKYKNYEYYFYNDEQQDEFMKTQFTDIYDAYQKCPLIVMKSDLWRYCVIFKYGGIYADADTICYKNPICMIKNSLFVGVPENINDLCQWVFSAPANSPLLKSVIDLSVERIRSAIKFKGRNFVHYYTGPTVFTEGIDKWLTTNKCATLKNKMNYSVYHNNIMHIHLFCFHKNNVKHLYSGSWDDGWKHEKKTYLQKNK